MPDTERRMYRPSRRRGLLLACVSLLTTAGCEGASPGADAVVVRDSAGVRIVESRAPAWEAGDAWRLSAEPVLQIGLAEGAEEYLLSRVTDLHRRPDGSVALVNAGSRQVRFYDGDGRHQRSIGSDGEGPGEFRAPLWIHFLLDDSLLVNDRGLQRLSIFSPDGRFVRSFALDAGEERVFPSALGAFGDGTLLVRVTQSGGEPPNPDGGVERSAVAYLRFSATGELLDSLAVLPGEESVTGDLGTMVLSMPVLFGRSSVAAVAGDRAYLGANDAFEIGVYSPDGQLRTIIRRPGDGRPVQPEEVQRFREGLLGGEENEMLRSGLQRMLSRMPVPETHVAFHTFLPDDQGNLWVQETEVVEDEPSSWVVVDPDGRLLGAVQLPPRFRPRHIGDDFVLGVWRDELDVERVRMYRLEKPE